MCYVKIIMINKIIDNMILLPPELIEINKTKIKEIDDKVKAIYRNVTFSRKISSKNLLDTFVNSTNNLTDLLSIKNAQMEAQNEIELKTYHKNLNKTIIYVLSEIKNNITFTKEIQLFQLFRLLSPESYKVHPNRYRDNLVLIGNHICPDSREIPHLVSQLFYNIENISNPIIRAIYFHHELIRIHPFADGNGRVTRIAKNWILMYDLYPPIFIKDSNEKKEYINALSSSFESFKNTEPVWNKNISLFFEQELNRILRNVQLILDEMKINL